MLFELLSFLAQNFAAFILHLSGSSFPRPLTKEAEAECIELIGRKDRKAREKLINHNLRLVAHVIKKYNTSPCEQEDLISIGTIGLIKAVDSFKSDKNIRFSTYASRCIENEILMHFRRCKKNQGTVFINDPLDVDSEGNALTLMDVMSDEHDIAAGYELKNDIHRLKAVIDSRLSPREKEIVILRFGLFGNEPQTQNEIAARLRISRSYVSRIEKRAVGILSRAFEAVDNGRSTTV